MRRVWRIAFGAAGLVLVSPLVAPQLLAFPYKAQTQIGTVWSERPIDRAALNRAAGKAQELLAESPIADANETRPIFLTDGGWRWTWLANTTRGGFAFTRPVTSAVVLNDTDIAAGTVSNGRAVRTLPAILTHEFVHGIQRRRYGLKMAYQPQWKVEGYADHVAQESTLNAEQAAALRARGEDHPALPYFEGRQRVEAILAENGNDVDALFGADD